MLCLPQHTDNALKYSCCFLLHFTFPMLNTVSKFRTCSEALLATFRFFTRLWAVIQPWVHCQDVRSALKKLGSTFRSWSSVKESFPTRRTSETLSVRKGICCGTILLLWFGWGDAGVLRHCSLFTHRSRVTKEWRDRGLLFVHALCEHNSGTEHARERYKYSKDSASPSLLILWTTCWGFRFKSYNLQ